MGVLPSNWDMAKKVNAMAEANETNELAPVVLESMDRHALKQWIELSIVRGVLQVQGRRTIW